MLEYLFFCLLIILIIYAYRLPVVFTAKGYFPKLVWYAKPSGFASYQQMVDHNGQFTATASAIKQIWSGNCRLACRQPKVVPPRGRFSQSDDGGTSSQIESVYQDNCICASCPCGLVENVLQTCSPVTQVYSTIVEAMFLAFYDLIKACTHLYERYYTQLEISKQRTEGRKISQVGTVTQVTNFMFENISKNVINRSEGRNTESEPGTSNGQKKDEVRTRVESPEDYPDTICPSCIEKGMTCIGRCPARDSARADKKD